MKIVRKQSLHQSLKTLLFLSQNLEPVQMTNPLQILLPSQSLSLHPILNLHLSQSP